MLEWRCELRQQHHFGQGGAPRSSSSSLRHGRNHDWEGTDMLKSIISLYILPLVSYAMGTAHPFGPCRTALSVRRTATGNGPDAGHDTQGSPVVSVGFPSR